MMNRPYELTSTYVIFWIEHHQTLTVDMEDFSNLSFILVEKFGHFFGYIWGEGQVFSGDWWFGPKLGGDLVISL